MQRTADDNTREAQKARTRESILAAAEALFARQGYEGTHFSDLTARCGSKRSLILYYFESKDLLWQAAVRRVSGRFNDALQAGLAGVERHEDSERLRQAISAFIDALIAVPEYGQIMLREGSAPGERMDWIARHMTPPAALQIRFKDGALQARVTRSIIRDILSSTLIAMVTLAPLLDASLAAALHRESAGIYPLSAERKQELVDLLVAMILNPEP